MVVQIICDMFVGVECWELFQVYDVVCSELVNDLLVLFIVVDFEVLECQVCDEGYVVGCVEGIVDVVCEQCVVVVWLELLLEFVVCLLVVLDDVIEQELVCLVVVIVCCVLVYELVIVFELIVQVV